MTSFLNHDRVIDSYDSDSTDTVLTVSSYANSVETGRKNSLVLCELFHPRLHGFNRESDRSVLGHYLIIEQCSTFDKREMDDLVYYFQTNVQRIIANNPKFNIHPWIRNYKNIVLKNDYIRPEIAKCIYLAGDEKVAILKTFWLRIVQRAWKRLFQERCLVRRERQSMYSLVYKRVYGAWPESCEKIPTSQGILVK
jgi:hypothetical protein